CPSPHRRLPRCRTIPHPPISSTSLRTTTAAIRACGAWLACSAWQGWLGGGGLPSGLILTPRYGIWSSRRTGGTLFGGSILHRLDLWRHGIVIEIQGEEHGVESRHEIAAQLDAEHAIAYVWRRTSLSHSAVRAEHDIATQGYLTLLLRSGRQAERFPDDL